MKKIKWGILGTGRIAKVFAEALTKELIDMLDAIRKECEIVNPGHDLWFLY